MKSTEADALVIRRVAQVVALLGTLTGALAIVIFSIRAKEGMKISATADEAEYFVVGRLLRHGRHLYGDLFSHHGPFPQLIAHFYASWISESDFSYIRLFQVIFAGVACAAVAFSPALQTKSGRVWAVGVYLLLLSFVWNVDGFNTILYPTMSGLLLVPLVAQYVVPLALDRSPDPFWLFGSGATATMAFFCAYSNAGAILLLTLSPVTPLLLQPHRERVLLSIRPLVFGMVAAATAIGIWILKYGDLKGYFVYHIYFNQTIYSQYIGFTFADFLKNFLLSFEPEAIVHSVALALAACSVYFLALLRKVSGSTTGVTPGVIVLVLVVAGVVFSNPRAAGYVVDAGFVTLSLTLFALSGACLLDNFLIRGATLGVISTILVFGAALVVTSRVEGYASFLGFREKELVNYTDTMKPAQDTIYRFIRTITNEDGDLLVLNFYPTIFFKTDRLPVAGHLYYLPWQAAYDRHPKGGYKLDICADIRTHRPAVIWFFNWRVWGKYSLDDYEPCLLGLITDGYTPLRYDSPWHVRNDLYQKAVATLPSDADTSLKFWPPAPKILNLSARLTRFAPIEVMMSPTHFERQAALRRIGILFGTYGRQDSGEVELRLKGPGGAEDTRSFSLSDLEENKYHFFTVEPKFYTTGEIRSVTGEGISTWESHLDKFPSYTCVIYEYLDNTRRYTPECPVM